MSDMAGFNIEDLINISSIKGDDEMQEPKVEQLLGKLRRLQQGKRLLEGELGENISLNKSLQVELGKLQTEADKLEGIHKEKEDMCRKLQFQCEESEQESIRKLKQNQKSEELLEQYRCGIQEFKLKLRKQRMKFENQLLQLTEQHRNLHSVFTTEAIPDEIKNAENMLTQLLSAEQLKLKQLHCLNEELQNMRKQKQQDPVTTDSLGE